MILNISSSFASSKFVTIQDIVRVIETVIDPEVGLNLIDLGVIYGLEIHGDEVLVIMTFTVQTCPLHEVMVQGVKTAVEALAGVKSCRVEIVMHPPWQPSMISAKGRMYLEGRSM